mgnify:CR=1 FL=1
MNKNKASRRTKYINSLFSRVLLSIVFLLGSVIFIKSSNDHLLLYKEQVFEKSFQFASFNKLYKKYLGSILPFDNVEKIEDKAVFNETFKYDSQKKYKDGTKFTVDTNYLMPALQSGIVVFIGEKEGYGQTVIIQGTDGVDVWYANINSTLKLYDYVEKQSLVGESINDELIILVQKDNEFIEYSAYEQTLQN